MFYSDDQLIQFIRSYNKQYACIPSSSTFHQYGFPASTTYKRRFGSWRAAIEKAGLLCRSKPEAKKIGECKQCGKIIKISVGEQRKSKTGRAFCDSSCAASFNNAQRVLSKETKGKISSSLIQFFTDQPKSLPKPILHKSPRIYAKTISICLNCSSVIEHIPSINRVFCSTICQGQHRWRSATVPAIERGEKNNKGTLRKYLIERDGYRCVLCNLTTWCGAPIPLCVDHINGNPTDDSPLNLRLLCQNCHGQTPTFAGRNKGSGRQTRGIRRHDSYDINLNDAANGARNRDRTCMHPITLSTVSATEEICEQMLCDGVEPYSVISGAG